MVLALIVTLPRSLPMQTNPIQKGMRIWSNTNHTCTHTASWAANATYGDRHLHKLEHAYTHTHTHFHSMSFLIFVCSSGDEMIYYSVSCRIELPRGHAGFTNDWKIKSGWKANLTPFLLWWLSWPICCSPEAGVTHVRIYSRCSHLCVWHQCLHAYTKIYLRAHACMCTWIYIHAFQLELLQFL